MFSFHVNENRFAKTTRASLWLRDVRHPGGSRATWRWIAPALLALGLGSGCSPNNGEEPSAVSYRIDTTLTAPGVPSTIESAGEERPVGLMIGPDGVAEGFVIDEVLVRAETQAELDAFLAKYNGIVLRDGTISSLPDDLRVNSVPQSEWYLVRVELSRSSLDDLSENMEAAGVQGELAFSSEEAARLAAIVAREAAQGAWANLLMYLTSSLEHPDYSGGYLDAESFPWMHEDAYPYTDGDQGLSVGVTRAWDYLAYMNIPPTPPPGGSVSWSPTRVAVIDSGFALDPTTGVPLLGNVDYFNSLNAPLQWDVNGDDNRAGGASDVGIDGGGTSVWHGQKAFGVCCAAERNQFGTAGVAGPVAQPILIRNGGTLYSTADAIYKAANMGAHVISISMGGACGTLCALADIFWDNRIGDSVIAATDAGAVVLAGAGNRGIDLANVTFLPCELYKVICVGSIRLQSLLTGETITDNNFGDNVAISAPTDILSTVTPDAVALDADNYATGPPIEDELAQFGGTSCATAFASGVVALMKAADPTLKWDEVLDILQTTANPSTDSRVPRGYVDAYRAVAAILPNQPPTIQITSPPDGYVVGWRNPPSFKVTYNDPEVAPADIYRWAGEVVLTAELDGELCRSILPPYTCTTTLPELTLGTQFVTATATDPFGASSIYQIKLTVVNRPPQPDIIRPTTTETLYAHIPVLFSGYVPDPDETIEQANISWSSSLDGPLGTGSQFTQKLTAGTHAITLTAVDGKGLSGSDQVTVTVVPGAGLPTPLITLPLDGTLVGPGQMITLQGSATDPEDGELTGTSLTWSSSVDGPLGTGSSLQVTLSGPAVPCNPESIPHTLSLTATDSDGHAVTVTITIWVGFIC